MKNQYEKIGAAFQDARQMPVTRYLEAPSVLRAAEPIRGKSVIDFACGDGFFTREWKRLGAERVVGVDLSPEMIDLARRQEEAQPIGIEYLIGDVSRKKTIGAFDLATAIFLFNYAADVETLARMIENVAGNLAPDGRLVAVVPNPDFVNGRQDTRKYGYIVEELARGPANIRVRMTFTEPRAFSIEFTQWEKATYETLLAAAGFGNICWTKFSVSDEGREAFGAAFWQTTLDNPKSVIFSAVKG